MKTTPQSRRDEHKEATRAALLRAGRKVFAKEGYAGASLSGIAKAARVTTGAVYHHFKDKADLFRAVAEGVERDIMGVVIAAAEAVPLEDQLGRLFAGFDAMLQAVAAPEIQRIALTDAPVVFGPENWRKVEEKYVYGALVVALTRLREQGRLAEVSLPALTPMLFGAMSEAALTIARSADPQRARAEAIHALALMLKAIVK